MFALPKAPPGPPPAMHPNRIEAQFIDMRNKGQFWFGMIGGPPLPIHDWRDKELKRWEAAQNA